MTGLARDRTTTDVEDWFTTRATARGVFGLTPSSPADFYRHPALAYLTLRGAPPVTSSLIWLDHHTASVAAFAEQALHQTRRSVKRTQWRGRATPLRGDPYIPAGSLLPARTLSTLAGSKYCAATFSALGAVTSGLLARLRQWGRRHAILVLSLRTHRW
ncbi:hypothetical protein AB0362_20530 [Rhodococcus sp. NPDC079359]|uniref:hypothetical protein n=1 Tax=Rhodococcus sp. NPDC079359 TaxID=3154961 RepID=UPI00344D8EC5